MHQRLSQGADWQRVMEPLLELAGNGGHVFETEEAIAIVANESLLGRLGSTRETLLGLGHSLQVLQQLYAVLRQIQHVLPALQLVLKGRKLRPGDDPKIEQTLPFRHDLLLPVDASQPLLTIQRFRQSLRILGIGEFALCLLKLSSGKGSLLDEQPDVRNFLLRTLD
jgi:hypothetical protein